MLKGQSLRGRTCFLEGSSCSAHHVCHFAVSCLAERAMKGELFVRLAGQLQQSTEAETSKPTQNERSTAMPSTQD